MTKWGDLSSDEESFNEDTPMDKFEDSDEEEEAVVEKVENLQVAEPEEEPPVEEPPREPRTYDLPSGPPYTLFVGNLSYAIKDGHQLGQEVAKVVRARLKTEINVVRGKIGFDRHNPNSNRHKGFGYVEVSSLEEMKLTLTLNEDSGANLAGRKVQLDTANHNTGQNRNNNNNQNRGSRRASAPPEADGRQFRQGKYQNNNNQNNKNRRATIQDGGPPAGQRPSLKLKPRTKPVEGAGGGSRSDIFGGAPAKDGNAWAKKDNAPVAAAPAPAEEAPAPAEPAPAATNEESSGPPANKNNMNNKNNQNNNNKQNKRQSGRGGGRGYDNNNNGRGGRGRGGGGRDNKGRGGRGDRKNNNKGAAPAQKAQAPQGKAAAAAPAPAPAPAPAAKPNNSFSALAFDSDSD